MPLDRRTRATFRSAELGFLGVMILTWRQTPRFCGQPCMAGCFGRLNCGRRGLRTSWLMVGMHKSPDRVHVSLTILRREETITVLFTAGLVKGESEGLRTEC